MRPGALRLAYGENILSETYGVYAMRYDPARPKCLIGVETCRRAALESFCDTISACLVRL